MFTSLDVFAKLLLYAGTALVVGVAITRRDPGRLGLPAALGVMGGVLLWLEAQRRALEFSFGDLPVLLASGWGINWMFLAAAALLAATGLHCVNRGYNQRWSMPLVGLGALALAITLGGLGHANADNQWPVGARILDAVHVLAMGSWVGVLTLSLADFSHLDRSRWNEVSRIAVVAAPLVVVTGLLSALRILGPPAPTEMIGWPYGRLLMSKVFLVVLMLGLGALHHQSISSGRNPRLLSMRLEVVLIGAVIVVTAILTGTNPPE